MIVWSSRAVHVEFAKHEISLAATETILECPRNIVYLVRYSRLPLSLGVLTYLSSRPEKARVTLELASAFTLLLVLADQCNVDLPLAAQLKIKLNAKKYPAVLVRCGARPLHGLCTTCA